MAAGSAARFGPRPAVTVVGELCDALGWPRSRPPRLLAGEPALQLSRIVLCSDESALAGLEAGPDVAALLASPPAAGGERLGRRAYDPFVGSPDDVGSWRRAERVVLDGSLLLAGGRGGVDERMCERIGLQPLAGMAAVEPLRPVTRDVVKLVGYVPTEALEAVRDAVFEAGAGTIGAYDRCSWQVAGTGTFRGGPDTTPAVGNPGEFERVAEARFEVVVARRLLPAARRAFLTAHPYEEPAFDVVAMELPDRVGFGRLGQLGAGGGRAAWSALAEVDPALDAYGPVDRVAGGATCAVHAGPVRDLLEPLLDVPDLALAIVAQATELELELLAARGIAVLVLHRSRAFDAVAHDMAGLLTRALTLPVAAGAALQFPEQAQPAPSAAPASRASGSEADPAAGTWRLHFDGGSRGNPGPAAYGWVLYDPDGDEHEADGVRIGTATNNVAEWTGLLRGLEHAAERGIRNLSVRGDSELVVKQVTGAYKVKNAALKPLAEQVAAVMRRFERVDVRHVYRADNARADAVANEAMDGLR